MDGSEEMETHPAISNISKGNYEFAKKLFKVLCKNEGNVFFSPISIFTTLSLLSQGSERETLTIFQEVLDISSEDAKREYKLMMDYFKEITTFTLYMANKIYLKDTCVIKELFKAVANENYHAEVESVNFCNSVETANLINNWVREKTHQKISEIIDNNELNSDTRLILLNAIYFKAEFCFPFNESGTHKAKFHLNNNKSVEVDMMTQTKKFRYGALEELNSQILALPYNESQASLYIILPNEIEGINTLEEKFDTFNIFEFVNTMYWSEVKVSLPKFKIDTTINLNKHLKEIGLKKLYEDPQFDGLLENNEPLNVSSVIQKAYIDVNEKGTEAAALTKGVIRKTRCLKKREPITFTADHPFIILLIKNDVDIMLFCGRISNL